MTMTTAATFLDLPVADQQAIVDHVRAAAELMTDKLSSLRVLSDRDLEDVCRWTIDAYLPFSPSYDDGFAAGIDEATEVLGQP